MAEDALPIVVVGGGADDASEDDGGGVAVTNNGFVDVAVPVLGDGVWSEAISRKAVLTTSELKKHTQEPSVRLPKHGYLHLFLQSRYGGPFFNKNSRLTLIMPSHPFQKPKSDF